MTVTQQDGAAGADEKQLATVRSSRHRALAAASLAAALTMGGLLTACDSETPKKDNSASAEAEDAEDTDEANAAAEEESPFFAAGETAAYENGLKITVSEAEPYTPGEYALGHTEGNQAHKVTISLENSGDEAIDISLIMPNAKAGDDGVEAEKIYDGDAMGGSFDGTLQPGKKATTDFAFDAPPEATNLDIEIDQLFEFSTEPAFWELEI